MSEASKIFAGYRALGFVSSGVPLAVRYHQKHKENYVVTACSKLGIVSVSDSHPEEISVLGVDRALTFTACRNVVRAFTRGKQVKYTYEGHKHDVHLLLPFGQHLISVDRESTVIIWDIQSQDQYLELQFNNGSFEVTSLLHPSTYMNKVVLGSRQGELQLWNVKANKLVYTFQGWGQPVTVLTQAPALDVVAVGLENGQIILHNLKVDETITKFLQDWGPVTSISFRTDGHPIMATGSASGHIALWDLEERKLRSQMREAHAGAVTGMQCLPSEPLMVTSAADNTLKVWIFDMPDGGGRLLRERSGHSAPVNKLRHYGNDGRNILSAASYHKSQTKKKTLKYDQHRMPYIVNFVAEPSRQSDWDNILAYHRGLNLVTTWNYQRSTMGEHKFLHQRFTEDAANHRNTVAQCVEITSCGNFGLIGYSSGHVDVYNLQSGLQRGSYGEDRAHSSSVQGVVVDGLNQVTLTSGRDGDLKFWSFKQKKLLETVKLESPVSSILLHRESAMLAVARDDFHVNIVDVDGQKVAFSSDARWLVTAAMDCSLRVWDLPTGRLIDCFLVDSAVTSLTLSPTSDFLVTSHLDDCGVYLWSNKTLFSHVALKALPENYEPQLVDLPSTGRQTPGESDQDADGAEEEFVRSEFKSPEQISSELVTLSLLPNSRWQNLLHLDIVKQRNRPKQPPKAPKAAPFFLPTVAGLEPKFALPENQTSGKTSKVAAGSLMPLCTLDTPVLDYIKSLSPSAVDVEIRSLDPDMGGSLDVLRAFIQFAKATLETNRNFEIIQAYLGLFLKVHGDELSSQKDLVPDLEALAGIQATSWSSVQDSLNQTLCLVNYLRTAVL
ncbi:WDR36-like protein [Mya arenaria]|uniref:WDR36-like protein n=1 Tax=Mya arenaria TaxID=6604 RepID=A0ABY7FQY1_MYAAR|nr:WDR36-like protein [Mya arenaria]